MIIKINQYGEILEIGEANNVFISYTGNSCMHGDSDVLIRLPLNGPIFAIDLQGNLYVTALSGSVDYYSGYGAYREGKIKQIGRETFDYYSGYGAYCEGKIRCIGSIGINYYSGYGAYREGKVRSIGGVEIDYYSG